MIRIHDDFVSINHYKKIIKIGLSEIHIEMKHYVLIISGEDLIVFYLNKDEIILKGKINRVDFNE